MGSPSNVVDIRGKPNAKVLCEPMYRAQTTSSREKAPTRDAAKKIDPLCKSMNTNKTLTKCALELKSNIPASLCSAVTKVLAMMASKMASPSSLLGSFKPPSAADATPGIKRKLIPRATGKNA